MLTVSEMNGRDTAAALEERRLDAALIPDFKLWPHASSLPICHERLIAALPVDHPLAGQLAGVNARGLATIDEDRLQAPKGQARWSSRSGCRAGR
jgi:DNA-binding transcriptional LysR family regulator